MAHKASPCKPPCAKLPQEFVQLFPTAFPRAQTELARAKATIEFDLWVRCQLPEREILKPTEPPLRVTVVVKGQLQREEPHHLLQLVVERFRWPVHCLQEL